MNDGGDEGLLVGSGGFTVDRAHALRKLRAYQLPATVGGWLLWARCAAASGADEAVLSAKTSEVSVRFAGRPFTRAELEDPFAPLFAERRTGRERGVQLALGILQALAGEPKEVVVASGAGPDRVALTVRSLEDTAVTPAPGSDRDTVLKVVWPFGSDARERFLTSSFVMFRSVPRFHPDRFRLSGLERPIWPAEAAAGRPFKLGSALGRLALPSFYTPPDSHLSLYKLGAFVCEHRELIPWAKVQGWVNDDKLRLSASQTGVAPDARFRGLMRLLAREAEAMLRETARAHPPLMKEARRAMDVSTEARAVWDRRVKWGPQAGADAAHVSWLRRRCWPGMRAELERRRLVLRAAEATLWLRDAEARFKTPGRTPPAGLAEAVADALAASQGRD